MPDATPGPIPPEPPRPRGAFLIVPNIPAERSFAIASGRGGFLVAYSDRHEREKSEVLALHLNRLGTPHRDGPVRVSDADGDTYLLDRSGEYGVPGVAFDGSGFGVSFLGFGDVTPEGGDGRGQTASFARVSLDGRTAEAPQVLETEISFSTAFSALQGPVDVAYAPGAFYTLLQHLMGGIIAPSTTAIWRTTEDEAALPTSEETLALELLQSDDSVPAITEAGSEVFVVFSRTRVFTGAEGDEPTGFTVVSELRGTFLAPGREPRIVLLWEIRATGVPSPLESGPTGIEGQLLVASNGADGFLVVWTEDDQIRGLPYERGDPTREPSAGFLIADAPGEKTLGGLEWLGDHFLLVWQEAGGARGRPIRLDGVQGDVFEIDRGPLRPQMAMAQAGNEALVLVARINGASEESVDLEGIFVRSDGAGP